MDNVDSKNIHLKDFPQSSIFAEIMSNLDIIEAGINEKQKSLGNQPRQRDETGPTEPTTRTSDYRNYLNEIN